MRFPALMRAVLPLPPAPERDRLTLNGEPKKEQERRDRASVAPQSITASVRQAATGMTRLSSTGLSSSATAATAAVTRAAGSGMKR